MITESEILAAHARIRPFIHRTPVLRCTAVDELAEAELFFKCENFQKIGAFKIRGATNAVLSLSPEQRSRGVATHSSGNHAQALALAARLNGIRAYVVMPGNASAVKRRAVEGYGAEVVSSAETFEDREAACRELLKRTGAEFVHPFNDERVIAGQATAAVELLEQQPRLDAIVTPVGGGGLISGTALAARFLSPETAVYGTEPAGADDAWRSLRAGRLIQEPNPQTIADGLRGSIGELTFAIIKEHVKDIIRVDDAEIIAAMRLVWERMKIVIEPSAAVALAGVLRDRERFRGRRVGIIVSGGNVDLSNLPF